MWRPGDDAPADDDEAAALLFPARHVSLPISRQRQLLPIARCRDSLLYALEKFRTVRWGWPLPL